MELTSFELEALNKLIKSFPTKKDFVIEDLLRTTSPYNNGEYIKENELNLSELQLKLREFLLDKAFADDRSNPFTYQYVEGQESNEFAVRLTNEGIKLKESGNYSIYLKILKKEKDSIRNEKIKNNVNLTFSILAAIASIIALILEIKKK
ncbi:hypothetical protein [Mucilaginibacter sp. 3215]|uniref:hypothetical protein n=1 Tax=Mucilaginibacter sp. 3215 TaxID=3373912 RepID=UPI003D1DD4D2